LFLIRPRATLFADEPIQKVAESAPWPPALALAQRAFGTPPVVAMRVAVVTACAYWGIRCRHHRRPAPVSVGRAWPSAPASADGWPSAESPAAWSAASSSFPAAKVPRSGVPRIPSPGQPQRGHSLGHRRHVAEPLPHPLVDGDAFLVLADLLARPAYRNARCAAGIARSIAPTQPRTAAACAGCGIYHSGLRFYRGREDL
jgi:hypothetical protein